MNTAIEIQSVSKMYRLGVISTGTVSHDLKRWWTVKVMRQEDPYLKVGETNVRSEKGSSDYVWALRDINLSIQQGEVLGIIGKNGAGKSTLLKLLSRVTKPTTGTIKYAGRIASLLEVGTGFHPEMTGRENIFMNGSIMGMTRQEINAKFDEIVQFAGVERYIDTPTKRYSSGMTVRLGFSIAAHLEPDILVVDEVLAVGDAEFQKKAIGKMQDVSKAGGRTVLFVSHNMAAVQSLCTKGVLLENGQIHTEGSIEQVVNTYLNSEKTDQLCHTWTSPELAPGNDFVKVKQLSIEFKNPDNLLTVENAFSIQTDFWNLKAGANMNLSLVVNDSMGDCVFNIYSHSQVISEGVFRISLDIPANFMNDGVYSVDILFVHDTTRVVFLFKKALVFEIVEKMREDTAWYGRWQGAVRPTFLKWNFDKLE